MIQISSVFDKLQSKQFQFLVCLSISLIYNDDDDDKISQQAFCFFIHIWSLLWCSIFIILHAFFFNLFMNFFPFLKIQYARIFCSPLHYLFSFSLSILLFYYIFVIPMIIEFSLYITEILLWIIYEIFVPLV